MGRRSAAAVGLIVLMAFASAASAQPFTLNQVLQLASKETPDRTVIEQTYQGSLAEANTLKSEIFPKLNLTLNGNRVAQALSGLQLGSSANQGDGQGGGNAPSGDPPSHIYGNQYGWQLGFKTPLVGFGRLGIVYKLSKMQGQFAAKSRDLNLQFYYLTILQAYNQALLNLNTFEAAKKSEKYAAALLKFNEIEVKNGSASQIDFLRSQSNHALARAELNRTENDADAALQRLKTLLNIPESQAFELQSGTDVAAQFLAPRGQTAKRLEIEVAEQQTEMAQQLAQYRSRQFWPTLYLTAGAESSILDFGGGFDREGADEPEHAFQDENITYSVGLSLEWLLFDGFARSETAKKAGADAIIAKTELDKLKRNDAVAKSEAKRTLKVTEIVFQASETARKAAQLAFDKINSDFQAGTASLTDVLGIQSDLYEAEKQLYDAVAARILAAAHFRIIHGIDLTGGQ